VRAHSGQEVLLAPAGWLPDVDRYGVVGSRLDLRGCSYVETGRARGEETLLAQGPFEVRVAAAELVR
jgi:hypothetical protein